MTTERKERAEDWRDRELRLDGAAEHVLLEWERRCIGADASAAMEGLAFSGGGIRSAAFAMGVTQALVAGKRLERFHYLSTVSGGGYFGAALTWWLHRGLPTPDGSLSAGTTEADFPFGHRSRTGRTVQAQNAVLDYVRQHASYLRPTAQLGLLSAVAVVLRSSSLSLLVYFTLLTGLMGLVLSVGLFDPVPSFLFGQQRWLEAYLSNVFLVTSALIVGLLGALALGYAVSTRFLRGTRSYAFRTRVQQRIGGLLALSLVLFGMGLLPLLYLMLDASFRRDPSDPSRAIAMGALSTLVGMLLGAQEGKDRVLGKIASRFAALRPILGLGLVGLGLLVGALAVADRLRGQGAGPLEYLVLTLAAAGLGHICNINYLGIHRMYRDRLMELFTPSAPAVLSGEWRSAEVADSTAIHEVCGLSGARARLPYHLINTNVVLVDSHKSEFRGRGGDSFVLSPLYCGSRATGWIRSDRYMNAEGGRGMSLPSAMAISGAAVNPNAGVGGRGLTRGRLGSALLSLLNLRLGYFAPNPARSSSKVPNFLNPGITAGVFGRGLSERSRIVELTDGGHFENLGIYELLRRRVTTIVVTDAGQDGGFRFGDLANAVERARVDFGVKISFDPDYDLEGVVPGAGREGGVPTAQRAFALAKIHYPRTGELPTQREMVGQLVYIKATLIPGLPADVLGYRHENADFPHQSTSDQFFDERQFEAYRELGYHAGWNYIEAAQAMQRSTSGIAPGPRRGAELDPRTAELDPRKREAKEELVG